jgi:NADH:ubiquinone oxidoreductase subunit 4 (subunit M)
MPIIPFHIWLPEAHCEAPTAGSVLLAGVLLKLGGYGFLRFSLSFFPEACSFFAPMIYALSAFGVMYASLTTLQQVDLKKIIAYTSVGHMGLVTAGIFSQNIQGIYGSILLMLAHGITSPGLFISIGFLYERYGTRIVKYYGGLIHTMPMFSVIFILFTLANLGLPATSNFIGEFLVLIGCFEANS